MVISESEPASAPASVSAAVAASAAACASASGFCCGTAVASASSAGAGSFASASRIARSAAAIIGSTAGAGSGRCSGAGSGVGSAACSGSAAGSGSGSTADSAACSATGSEPGPAVGSEACPATGPAVGSEPGPAAVPDAAGGIGRTGVRLGRALELASATEPGRLSVGASPGSCTAGGEEAGRELGSRACGRTTTAVTPLPFCSRSWTRTPCRAASNEVTWSPSPAPSALCSPASNEAGSASLALSLAHPDRRHADALVLHGEHYLAGLQQPAGELDMGVRRGEGGRVLQEFGEQVAEVVGGEPGDLGVRRQGLDGDPLVPFDLADGRAGHVDQRDRAGVAVAVLGAREDQHVLAVPAHDRGHVVQLEQGGEALRVLLALLQALDDAELPLDEAEVAEREVDEGVVDRVLQPLQLGGQLGGPDLEFGALEGEGPGPRSVRRARR